MKMVLMSGCGMSALFPLGDQDAANYWVRQIVLKGDIPTIKIMDESELA